MCKLTDQVPARFFPQIDCYALAIATVRAPPEGRAGLRVDIPEMTEGIPGE